MLHFLKRQTLLALLLLLSATNIQAQEFIGCRTERGWAESPMLSQYFHVNAGELQQTSRRKVSYSKSDAMSARNAFVKANWANGALVWMEWDEHEAGVGAPKGGDGNDGPSGEWALVPERLALASGTRHIGMGMTAMVRDGRLHIDCPDPGLDDLHAVKNDRLMVAVYRPAAEKF